MSMQQVKNRFEELASYLNRDTEGLKKLKSLKDAVNVLRTDRAAAAERADSAERRRDVAVQERRTAEAAVAGLHTELQRVRAECHSLTLQLQNARAIITGSDDKLKPARPGWSGVVDPLVHFSDGQSVALTFAVERLRKRQPYCPMPRSHLLIAGRPEDTTPERAIDVYMIWDREQLATGWSYEALWQLGASVAVLAASERNVIIAADALMSGKMSATVQSAAQLYPDHGGVPVPMPSSGITPDLMMAVGEYQIQHAANVGHWYHRVNEYKAAIGHTAADDAHAVDQLHRAADTVIEQVTAKQRNRLSLAEPTLPGFAADELIDVE